jgi:hypothetical protein
VFRICLAAFAAFFLFVGSATAHEGHDHGGGDDTPVQSASPRAEAHSDQFELVAIAGHESLTLYLDRYATGEPVDGAAIEIMTHAGSQKAAAQGDGIYVVEAPWVEEPGTTELTAVITLVDASDLLTLSFIVPSPPLEQGGMPALNWLWLGGVGLAGVLLGFGVRSALGRKRLAMVALAVALVTTVQPPNAFAGPGHDHSGAAEAQPGADLPRRLPDGTLFVPKPTQRLLKVRTIVTASGDYKPGLAVPGHIIADPNKSGVVQSVTGGKLFPPDAGFPLLGASVSAGDTLAFVQPPLAAIDSSDIRQTKADLDKQISLARANLARLRRAAESVPRANIEDAEIELRGLLKARADLEASGAPREALIAPVSGVIARADVTAGRVVAGGETLFQIIDTNALWVEALAYDPRVSMGVTGASARTSAGLAITLAFRGSGLATQNQAVPLRFAVESPPPGLRTDMPVTVYLTLDESRSGIAVPNAAIVRGLNGQPVVYVQTAAERFEARPVVVEPLDAARMLVTGGLGPDARIVVQGAELINQTR